MIASRCTFWGRSDTLYGDWIYIKEKSGKKKKEKEEGCEGLTLYDYGTILEQIVFRLSALFDLENILSVNYVHFRAF